MRAWLATGLEDMNIARLEGDFQIDAMFRLFDHYDRYGITGNSNGLSGVLNLAPTSLEQCVGRNPWRHRRYGRGWTQPGNGRVSDD